MVVQNFLMGTSVGKKVLLDRRFHTLVSDEEAAALGIVFIKPIKYGTYYPTFSQNTNQNADTCFTPLKKLPRRSTLSHTCQ